MLSSRRSRPKSYQMHRELTGQAVYQACLVYGGQHATHRTAMPTCNSPR